MEHRLTGVKRFLDERIGKVLVLHMSDSQNKTSPITNGIIDNVIIHDGNGMYKEGFQIQLKDRNGIPYGNIENFFGTFDFEEFQTEEKAFSDTLRIQYKDGSYFIIEVRI